MKRVKILSIIDMIVMVLQLIRSAKENDLLDSPAKSEDA